MNQDGRFFKDSANKRGEIQELKSELRSLDRATKKDGVKRVIAAMTVGKDVSMLFPDVVNCMQTDDLGLKKLVYLYVINYAKTQPDLAIMAVNTFVKDTQDPNPLIRALAVRTMGCIRVDKITEYLCDPLQRCLKDEDPYVRKTAAMCVAKLFDINPDLVVDRGFLDSLREMLSDANPMVVANALAALQEIHEVSGKDVLQITPGMLTKLLTALNDCTEWGQVFILDSLANLFDCKDMRDAEKVVERILPRLQHVNSAVVLSAVRLIVRMMEVCASNEDLLKVWSRKMTPPLVTLLGAEAEQQYVALRNISLIVQKRPNILANDVKVFFVKYNDPIYIKMEKLEIMIRLANDKNVDQVLLEFKEYAQEVDVDFVRKAVKAIGKCAVSIASSSDKCVGVLVDLIKTKVSHVVQEGVIVIKDILRRYPNRYKKVISVLCDNLETLDEPEAKAAMVWIIGEYAEKIDNSDALLEGFLDNFPEETSVVQLQLLTATVKLFLKKPTDNAQRLISLVLSCATNENDNPDLRDRAFVYWRLLSTDPEAAKEVVLSQKPVISDDDSGLDPAMLELMLKNVSTIASVYHKSPDSFVTKQRLAVQKVDDLKARKFDEEDPGLPKSSSSSAIDKQGDLLDLDAPSTSQPAAASGRAGGNLVDLLGDLDVGSSTVALPQLYSDSAKGITINGQLLRQNGATVYSLSISSLMAPLDGLMLQTNKSTFGLSPSNVVLALPTVNPGTTGRVTVPMVSDASKLATGPASSKLEVALKTNQAGVLYFADNVPLASVFEESGRIEGQAFLSAWKSLPQEVQHRVPTTVYNVEAAKAKLQDSNLFVLAHRPVPGTSQEALYVTGRVGAGVNAQLFVEIRLVAGSAGLDLSFKSEKADLATMTFEAIAKILQ